MYSTTTRKVKCTYSLKKLNKRYTHRVSVMLYKNRNRLTESLREIIYLIILFTKMLKSVFYMNYENIRNFITSII